MPSSVRSNWVRSKFQIRFCSIPIRSGRVLCSDALTFPSGDASNASNVLVVCFTFTLLLLSSVLLHPRFAFLFNASVSHAVLLQFVSKPSHVWRLFYQYIKTFTFALFVCLFYDLVALPWSLVRDYFFTLYIMNSESLLANGAERYGYF